MNKKNEEILVNKNTEIKQVFCENKIDCSAMNQSHIERFENNDIDRISHVEKYVSESDVDDELGYMFEEPLASNMKLGLFERLLNRVERLVVVLCHKIFDEVEAAAYLRLPDPETRGRETIRNYALRSKKISYYKIGRNGLTFLKADLDAALGRFKVQSFRDL